MIDYSEIKKELEARKCRSAWSRGVNAYALELRHFLASSSFLISL